MMELSLTYRSSQSSYYFTVMSQCRGHGCIYGMVGMDSGAPEASNLAALTINMVGSSGLCSANCLQAILDIGGKRVALQPTTARTILSTAVRHHIAVTYDGSTARLFLDGILLKSAIASGKWTVLPYESFMIADIGPQTYPGLNPSIGTAPAYYDSLRISRYSGYRSNFNLPTAKFVSDGNTVFLLNFPTETPAGTIKGFSGAAGNPSNRSVFIPIETSDGGADLNSLYIGNLSLSDNGIYANWMLNSTIENIIINGAGRTCVNLHDNDYQDTIRQVICAVVPFAKTNVGFLFLGQSNNNLYTHLQCDGQYSCIGQASGSGHYIMPDFSDRGFAIYPFYFIQGQALLDSPELDIEDIAPNQLAAIYSNGGYAPIVINGGQLSMGNPRGGAYLALQGGAPFSVRGTAFGSGKPAELLNVISNPTSPVTLEDVVIPKGLALTNADKQQWLIANQFGAVYDAGVLVTATPYMVAAYDRYVDCNATGGAIALDLPRATGSGRLISFKKTDSSRNSCTVIAAGSDMIDGSTTDTLNSQYVGVTVRDAASGAWDIAK